MQLQNTFFISHPIVCVPTNNMQLFVRTQTAGIGKKGRINQKINPKFDIRIQKSINGFQQRETNSQALDIQAHPAYTKAGFHIIFRHYYFLGDTLPVCKPAHHRTDDTAGF